MLILCSLQHVDVSSHNTSDCYQRYECLFWLVIKRGYPYPWSLPFASSIFILKIGVLSLRPSSVTLRSYSTKSFHTVHQILLPLNEFDSQLQDSSHTSMLPLLGFPITPYKGNSQWISLNIINLIGLHSFRRNLLLFSIKFR